MTLITLKTNYNYAHFQYVDALRGQLKEDEETLLIFERKVFRRILIQLVKMKNTEQEQIKNYTNFFKRNLV